MISLSLSEIAQATKGQLIGKSLTIDKVFTDSRQHCVNSLFVALVGENFDAHKFVTKAEENGAKALLVSKKVISELPQIIVEDTEQGLADIAQFVRTKVNPKVLAITGSAGKTTVKEMLASILLAHCGNDKDAVLATAGNFNNHIGVPLTLLNLTKQHKFAVIEMGANHQGEIAFCAKVAKPDVSAINNVMPAHIEGFGSIAGVAKAKAEIYQALAEDGKAVINLDSDYSEDWQKLLTTKQTLTVAVDNLAADVSAKDIIVDESGRVTFKIAIGEQELSTAIKLPIVGRHNVSNALVAAGLALSVGVKLESIANGLTQVENVKGRLNQKAGVNGSLIIDDTYNASVGSVKAAIDLLITLVGKTVLVMGDMAELGDASEGYHREIAAYAKEKGINKFYGCGKAVKFSVETFGQGGALFSDKEQLISALKQEVTAEYKVLVKGSRSAQMEEVVAALLVMSKEQKDQDDLKTQIGGGQLC